MLRNDDLAKGVAIGIGIGILVPVAVNMVAPLIQSFSRSAFKTAVVLYEKARETTERIGETVDDVIAEVEQEMIETRESQQATSLMQEAAARDVSADSKNG